jgi:hypothetical protein
VEVVLAVFLLLVVHQLPLEQATQLLLALVALAVQTHRQMDR